MAGGFTWVRWDSRLFTSSSWLSLPMDVRGVFSHLILLAIRDANAMGLVKEKKAEDIALLLRCPPDVVQKALETLAALDKVKLTSKGWRVTNIASFLPPERMRSHAQRGLGRTPDHGVRGQAVATTKTEITNEDEEVLATLQSASGWVPNDDTDIDFLVQWKTDFPGVDILAEAKSFKAWHSSRPPMKNFRNAFNNWLKNAVKFDAERREQEQPYAGPSESVREQMDKIEARMAVPA